MSRTQPQPDVKLPGYKFIDRLGSGGYGEVWRAEAPGGLAKAVKLVFGRYDQQRASIEMKAMGRMKSLRHPFLLSLERIEIIEDRLFIVTELADGSLRDRFRQCQEDDKPGIPRDELLNYLSDAAGALDFLCEQGELQHLDVKPENLLLVAGHVKVADFGLVKDIHSTQASLVGGMTPSYAAPELFQGRPTRFSDQYSLAILYQEMLTGTLPFLGATAAELTLQHINESPCLDPLSESDRFVVSQALSKDADHRFGSCREMIEAFRSQSACDSFESASSSREGPSAATARPATSFSGEAQPPEAHTVTQVFDDDQSEWSVQSAPVLFDLPEIEPCQSADPPAFAAESFLPTPTVIIGMGGTAAAVMRSLREQMVAELGSVAAQAAIGMLLIDTDSKSISAAVRDAGDGHPLVPAETLCAALRRPQDYRNDSSRLLRWLSRRWLYNIPKSLRTGGIRPLGRLALVDHARQVVQRIRLALQQAVEPERLAEIEDSTGLRFRRDAVRVYLVGSVAGGTGSGMMLDVAYLVRASLDRMELEEKRIVGVATHSTGRDSEQGELGRVNTFAWLAELDYLRRPDVAYPGDDSAGLPRHEPSVPPFDDAYLVDMGERLSQSAFAKETGSIADYLFVDTFTQGQTVLDACRAQAAEGAKESGPGLRTFGVRRTTRLSADASRDWAHRIRRGLLERWVGRRTLDAPKTETSTSNDTPSPSSTGSIVRGAAQFVGQQRLDAAGLAALGRAVVEKQLGGEVVKLLRRTIQEAGQTPETLTRDKAIERIDTLISGEPATEPQQWRIAGQPIPAVAAEASKRVSGTLRDWILHRCNMPQERIPSAVRAVEWFRDHLRTLAEPLDRMRSSLESQVREITESSPPESKEEVGKQVVRLWKLRIDLAAIGVARQMVGELAMTLDTVRVRLDAARDVLQSLLEASPESEHQSDSNEIPVGPWVAKFVQELDQQFPENSDDSPILAENGLLGLCEDEDGPQQLVDAIQHEAEELVSHSPTVRKLAAQQAGMGFLACDEATPDAEIIRPRLDEQGGYSCHLLLTPKGDESEDKKEPVVAHGTVRVETTLADAYCVTETWGLSVVHVAAHFVGSRRDYAQLASRVHVRQDIDWPGLLDNFLEEEEACISGSSVLATQVLAPS